MNRYVVSYINFYENELEMEEVVADDDISAIFQHSRLSEHKAHYEGATLKEIQEEFFNGDSMVNVLCVGKEL